MIEDRYLSFEDRFLRDVSDRCRLTPNQCRVFRERFQQENQHLSHEELARLKFQKDADGGKNWERTIRESLSGAIYPALQMLGYQPQGKCNWNEARRWLRHDYFPRWYQEQQANLSGGESLWGRLFRLGREDRGRFRAVPVGETATWDAMFDDEDEEVLRSFESGSRIRYQFKAERDGFLLVLGKGCSGSLYCYSPSKLLPQWQVMQGEEALLPAISLKPFRLSGEGVDEVVALSLPTRPAWSWLPGGGDKVRTLDEALLAQVLALAEVSEARVWCLRYRIVAPV